MPVKKLTVPEKLPVVYPYVAEPLAFELRDREQTRRIPEATAKVLVLMVLLYQKNYAFPPRDRIAEHLGVSVQTVDAVISQRQATRDIRIVHLAMKGSKQPRLAAIRGRRIIPSPWLLKFVAAREAEHAAAQKAMKPRRHAVKLVELVGN
jgi:hypothetical protein